MFDPQMHLVTALLARSSAALAANPSDAGAWSEAHAAVAALEPPEPELARVIDARDAAALAALVAEWNSDKRLLPVADREVLKRGLKAFRKSLKVTRLDAESSIGGGPMSAGRHSGILGMRPPDRYPIEVWNELARQGRLIAAKHGLFELPPE